MKGIVLSCMLLAGPAVAETYNIDMSHSSVGFRIKHLVSKVKGRFTKFEGSYDYDPADVKSLKAWAKIEALSINTDNERRDGHLRSPDFFDAEKCPGLEFKSTKVTDVKDNMAKLHGDLTMHCVTKPVVLDLEIGGVIKDPGGNLKSGFTATGKINRDDFGIIYNKALDNGGFMLGKEVEVSIEVEGAAAKRKS